MLAYRWRKRRLHVWRKRLQHQLNLLSPSIPCSLHVSWGPHYGGSVILNRNCKKAKIIIQIPYDRYMTPHDRQILTQYHLTPNSLPYFIFFHEYFHLLEATLLCHNHTDVKTYLADHRKAALSASNYRTLDFERCADEFAYQQYVNLCEKAG